LRRAARASHGDSLGRLAAGIYPEGRHVYAASEALNETEPTQADPLPR
jgi:hypothetical protein